METDDWFLFDDDVDDFVCEFFEPLFVTEVIEFLGISVLGEL